MVLTAWERYVEDRAREAVQVRLKILNGSLVGKFVLGKVEEEIRRFHNPGAEKTRRLFLDYPNGGPPAPHLVERDDLEKAIRFMKNLVQATDQALSEQ